MVVTKENFYKPKSVSVAAGKTMEHEDPNCVLLKPGKSDEFIWKFTKAAELEFAFNVTGHYDDGRLG